MKICTTLVLCLVSFWLQAQNTLPNKHFRPGQIFLPDNTIRAGYIRDYIRSNASIVFLDTSTGKKCTFTGAQLLSVNIDTTRFLCIRGDFFRVIATSDLWLLQKSSDASSKPAYNGAEPIFSNGTEGRPDDYFLYEPAGHTLQLVNSKTMAHVIPTAFFKQK